MKMTSVIVKEPLPSAQIIPQSAVTSKINPTKYPTQLLCWDHCSCTKDFGLCMYTCCCTPCAHADTMLHIDSSTCGCPVGWYPSCCCACIPSIFTYSLQSALNSFGLGFLSYFANFQGIVTCTSRLALKKKRGLDSTECLHPCCAHWWCNPCAIYQENLYLKHVEHKEPDCCCYPHCVRVLGETKAGELPFEYDKYDFAVNKQSVASVSV